MQIWEGSPESSPNCRSEEENTERVSSVSTFWRVSWGEGELEDALNIQVTSKKEKKSLVKGMLATTTAKSYNNPWTLGVYRRNEYRVCTVTSKNEEEEVSFAK